MCSDLQGKCDQCVIQCVSVSLTVCVRSSIRLVLSRSGWTQSGSNDCWIFTFQEVLGELQVTLRHNNSSYIKVSVEVKVKILNETAACGEESPAEDTGQR